MVLAALFPAAGTTSSRSRRSVVVEENDGREPGLLIPPHYRREVKITSTYLGKAPLLQVIPKMPRTFSALSRR